MDSRSHEGIGSQGDQMNSGGISLTDNGFSSSIYQKYTRLRSPLLRLPSLVFLFHPYGPVFQGPEPGQPRVFKIFNILNRHTHRCLHQHMEFIIDLCLRIAPPGTSPPVLASLARAARLTAVPGKPAVPTAGLAGRPVETVYLLNKLNRHSPLPVQDVQTAPAWAFPGESSYHHFTTVSAPPTAPVNVWNDSNRIYKSQLKSDYINNLFREEVNISRLFFTLFQQLFKKEDVPITTRLAAQMVPGLRVPGSVRYPGITGITGNVVNAGGFNQWAAAAMHHTAPALISPPDHNSSHYLHQHSNYVHRELNINPPAQPLQPGQITVKSAGDLRNRDIRQQVQPSYPVNIQAKSHTDRGSEERNYHPSLLVHPVKSETPRHKGSLPESSGLPVHPVRSETLMHKESFPASSRGLTVDGLPSLQPLVHNSLKSITVPAAHVLDSYSQQALQQAHMIMVHMPAHASDSVSGNGNGYGYGNMKPRSHGLSVAAGMNIGSFQPGITNYILLNRAAGDSKEPVIGPASRLQRIAVEMIHSFASLSPGIGNVIPGESSRSRTIGMQEMGGVPEIRYFNPLRQVEENVKQSLAAVEQTGQAIKRTVRREDQVDVVDNRVRGTQSPLSANMDINMNRLTDQVYRLLERKIKAEKERRGW